MTMPLAVEWTNLHQILRSLYADMLPLCSDMMGIAKGLAGLGALFFIAYRVWKSLAAAEPIEVFPLLRLFVPVSYTHLDVYKRQVLESTLNFASVLNDRLIKTGRAHLRELFLFWNLVDRRERTPLYEQYENCLLYTSWLILSRMLWDNR